MSMGNSASFHVHEKQTVGVIHYYKCSILKGIFGLHFWRGGGERAVAVLVCLAGRRVSQEVIRTDVEAFRQSDNRLPLQVMDAALLHPGNRIDVDAGALR